MKMFFLSGLPRTGSTLLSAILDQNPKIHAEGNSAVCQLMWDMQASCETFAREQLLANYRTNTQNDLVSAIPEIYYKNSNTEYVVDKCRSWTLPANMNMIKEYISDEPKVIVLTRPIDEIVESFVNIRKKNNWKGDPESGLLDPDSEPIMRSLAGVDWAKNNNNGEFLFIEYSDLVGFTGDIIKSIYDFFDIEFFNHDFNNVVNNHPENDEVYNLIGLHDIISKVQKKAINK
jgi:sulfotransferase